ncbi:trehalose-6-phosphate synthase, partial [Rhodococcus qingshengii]|nr:trehalose-6-phosphate synthase [Rhodococcus qingshengii]
MSGQAEFVVVANRLPVDLERLPDGTTRWKRSPGGPVTYTHLRAHETR